MSDISDSGLTKEMVIARTLADEAVTAGDVDKLAEAFTRLETEAKRFVTTFDVLIEHAGRKDDGDVSAVERVAMAAIELAKRVISEGKAPE